MTNTQDPVPLFISPETLFLHHCFVSRFNKPFDVFDIGWYCNDNNISPIDQLSLDLNPINVLPHNLICFYISLVSYAGSFLYYITCLIFL